MPLIKKLSLAIPLVLVACQAAPTPTQGPRGYRELGDPGIVGFNGNPPFVTPVLVPPGGPEPGGPAGPGGPGEVPPSEGPGGPAPSEAPSAMPSELPSEMPSGMPSELPSEAPSGAPSETASAMPSELPSETPTEAPTAAPTEMPTEAPTAMPTEMPTAMPTEAPTPAPTEAPTPEPTAAPTAAPAGPVAVDIPGHSFSPGAVTVPVGTTVTWTNNDKDPHTATNDDGSAVTFDSGMLSTGKSFSFTFTTPGTFAYHCTFHNEMHGTVTVTP